MSRRWLLMLGSNLGDDVRLREALTALEVLGALVALTPVLRTPARHGGGHYHNALAQLSSDVEPAVLRQAFKRIETALGRVRDGSGVVAIDIDPLAVDEGLGWQPDAYALEKGELLRAPVPQLLSQAGIVLPGAPDGCGTG